MTTTALRPPVVAVAGALDLAGVTRTRDLLQTALATGPERLVVDLTACTYVDASALAMLLDVHRKVHRRDGVLVLHGCSPRVLRLLSLTGLRRVFEVEIS